MQRLPVTLITSLVAIINLGTAYADTAEEDPYVIQQEHAAPVTITLPGSERSSSAVGNSSKDGTDLHASDTAAEATSIEDQQQPSDAYIEKRQKMIEDCERNNGIDCAREVDVELGAEDIQKDGVFHVMRRPHAMR